MEDNKNSLIVVVIVIAFLAGVGGAYIGGNIVKNNIESKEINNNDKDTENKEEKKEEEAPKENNSFYESMLMPYMYTPGDFEIDNISNQFLAQFVLNFYVFGTESEFKVVDDPDYDFKVELSKKEVSDMINHYFYQSNVILDNFENKDYYKLENSGDNYIFYVKNTDYDFADMTITNVSYNGNEITANYTLYNPYTPNEEVGSTTYKLKYENGNYKVLSKKTTMTKEW